VRWQLFPPGQDHLLYVKRGAESQFPLNCYKYNRCELTEMVLVNTVSRIDVINVFNLFNLFLNFCQLFFVFVFERSLKIPSRTLRLHFLKPQKHIYRPRFYDESDLEPGCTRTLWRAHYVQSSAYSDTAAVTSCSRRSQYVKS